MLQHRYFPPRLSAGFRADLAEMFAKAETVAITERIRAGRDPTDDKSLELAVNGHADVLVTGDLDLLVLHPFRGIPIVTPRVFGHARACEA